MFQTLKGVAETRRKGAHLLQLHCGHVKRVKWSGKMRHFCAWCAGGTLPTHKWKTPHQADIHPLHLRPK